MNKKHKVNACSSSIIAYARTNATPLSVVASAAAFSIFANAARAAATVARTAAAAFSILATSAGAIARATAATSSIIVAIAAAIASTSGEAIIGAKSVVPVRTAAGGAPALVRPGIALGDAGAFAAAASSIVAAAISRTSAAIPSVSAAGIVLFSVLLLVHVVRIPFIDVGVPVLSFIDLLWALRLGSVGLGVGGGGGFVVVVGGVVW